VKVPDYFDEFPNCDMVWDEKLGLVQDWQLLLTGEPLDDAGDLNKIIHLKTLSPVARVKECIVTKCWNLDLQILICSTVTDQLSDRIYFWKPGH
jgi:hypothetical protein